MAILAKRSFAAKRAKKRLESRPARPPPPPPFFSISRGLLYAPERTTVDVCVRVRMQQLQNPAAVHGAVLRAVLHRPCAASLISSSSAPGPDDEPADRRSVVHVESVTVEKSSARHVGYAGDVQLRATVAVVVAHVEHGVFVGVAESSVYADTIAVRLPCGSRAGDAGHSEDGGNRNNDIINNNNNNNTSEDGRGGGGGGNHGASHDWSGSNNNGGDATTMLVTARCSEREPVVLGRAVLVVSEPGTLRCVAFRQPPRATAAFKLHVEDDVAEIRVDSPATEGTA